MRRRKRKSSSGERKDDRFSWEDSPVDVILDCWLPIATVAWEGFLQHGRGVVYVRTIDGSWHLLYRPGATVRAHRSIVESYDPAKQAIVLVLREEDGPSLHVAEGWPSPPEAIGRTTADEVGETMH